jgi:hypothetical protein
MKFGPLQLSYSGIGITVAGAIAIAAVGGAAAAQHPPEQVTQVTDGPSASATSATLTADRTTLDIASVSDGEYLVRSGDTLAGIAGRKYGKDGCWPGIWAANSGKISNPDLIYVGQELTIPPACSTRGPAEVTAAVSHPAPAAAPRAATEDAGYSVNSSFQSCVIERESGGNPDIWNASGHWGLYQFSYSTWVAYGGAPAEFGYASAAEQTEVFDNAMATPGGADNWSPYDHCTV